MSRGNHPLAFGFGDMKPDIYLACLSTHLFEFSYRNVADHRISPYGKDYSSFCQIVEGNVTFEMLDGTILTGKAGDLFYMPEGTRYLSDWRGNPRIAFIGTYFRFFATNDLNHLISQEKYIVPFDKRFAFQKVDRLSDFQALEEMQAILKEYHSGKWEQMMAFSRIYRLMALAYPHLRQQALPQIDQAIVPAVIYIEKNYMRNDPVSVYSEMCFLSESRFFHLFQDCMHESPVEFRNKLRIHQAVILLSESNASIEAIGAHLGFASPEYFRRTFKKFLHVSPNEYRKNMHF